MAQRYNLRIWSLSNLLPSIPVPAGQREGEPAAGTTAPPGGHHGSGCVTSSRTMGTCVAGGSAGGAGSWAWQPGLVPLAPWPHVPPLPSSPRSTAEEHRWLPPRAGGELGCCVRTGTARSQTLPGDVPARPALRLGRLSPRQGERALTHMGSTGTRRQPKIFLVKVMLEMASALLVCSI